MADMRQHVSGSDSIMRHIDSWSDVIVLRRLNQYATAQCPEKDSELIMEPRLLFHRPIILK